MTASLYKYQVQIKELVLQGKSIILQAPTGAGKTRASLAPFISRYWEDSAENFPKKCIYTVPMRVLANQFNTEYSELADRYSRLHKRNFAQRPLNIAIQTGEFKQDQEFHADMTFATIDQVLSSWLMHPYSLPKRLGNLNAGAFVGSYLIFDEFHLFDPDSTLPTTLQMLQTLNGVSPFILMTATFSQEMLEKLAQHLDAVPFLLTEEMLTEIPAQQKDRRYFTASESLTYKDEAKKVQPNKISVAHILHTHQAQTNQKPRTLVVCNQVERAQAVYQALRDSKPTGVTVRLLHSRFLQADRQEIEQFVRTQFDKAASKHTVPSLIVVATQVVEVGLDMSCAVLHTELAPAASVLQRAGRCARYQNDVGKVYVYPLGEKGYAPYHGRFSKQQCKLTWEWLQANQDCHLTFADEQALINHAHTATDNLILQGVFGSAFTWKSKISAAWRGDLKGGEVRELIRNIQSTSIVVHADPDQLAHAPFAVKGFALHPGTLQGKFRLWKEQNDAVDDWEAEPLEWVAQKLVEDQADEDVQGNRPIQYAFKKITTHHELHAPLIAINPAFVGYSAELGLTLYPSQHYESAAPLQSKRSQYQAFSYKLESYYRHIELVQAAFIDQSLDTFQRAAHRLETAYGWQAGIITDMAHLIIVLHDVGKLNKGWQNWVHKWQYAIGKPISDPHFAAAHTDYDPDNPVHKAKYKQAGRKPPHAVEGALATLPLVQAILPDGKQYKPLLQAAFSAICRHHAPFSSSPSSYQLIEQHTQKIQNSLQLLSQRVRANCQSVTVQATTDTKQLPADFIERYFLIDPHNERAVCSYMLLVRALRSADQEGTRRGSK